MRCHSPWNSSRVARRGRVAARARSEGGFTLIEVLVSAVIVTLLAATVAQALSASANFSAQERERAQADSIAEQDQERLRGLSAEELNGLNQTRTVTLDGVAYSVSSVAAFLNSVNGSSCGSSGNGAAAYFSTKSTVTWNANTLVQRPAVVERSVITPPAGGTLLTQVQDQNSAALSGVTVNASGADVATGVTDASGCTILAGLTAGSYAVTLTDSGYVDVNGNTSPLSTSSTVSSTGTSFPSINPVTMGLAGSLTGTFQTTVSSLNYTGESDTLSWFGSGTSKTMSAFKSSGSSSSPVTTITASNLFPFAFTGPSYAGNYQVWPGRCVQQRPPTGTDMFGVSPGSSQNASVAEPALGVTSVKYSGLAVKPSDVKLTFTSGTGTACSYSWFAPISSASSMPATGWLANPGQPFASTGAPASASGQTGSLTACVDYNAGGIVGFRKASTASFTNTSFTSLNPVPAVSLTALSTSGQC